MRAYIFIYRTSINNTIKSCNPLTTWFYRNRLPSALKTKIQCKMRPSGRIAQMRGSDQTMQYQNGWWCLCVEAMNPSQKSMSLCVVNGFSMILSIYCHPRCVTLLPNFPSPTLHPFFRYLLYSIFPPALTHGTTSIHKRTSLILSLLGGAAPPQTDCWSTKPTQDQYQEHTDSYTYRCTIKHHESIR